MSNFKCENCGKEHTIPTFQKRFINGDLVATDKNGNRLLCECKTELTEIKEFRGFPSDGATMHFANADQEGKHAILKKRAAAHTKKTKDDWIHKRG